MNRFVMANPDKCIGCRTCEIACVVAHTETNLFLEEPDEFDFSPRLSVVKTAQISVPVQCRHCEDAPCANVCPNGSIFSVDNTIYINQTTCIGCKTCMLACPYGAIDLVAEFRDGAKVAQPGLRSNDNGKWDAKDRVVANKCDLCLGKENGPECVRICPTDALRVVEPVQVEQSVKEKRVQTAQHLFQFGTSF